MTEKDKYITHPSLLFGKLQNNAEFAVFHRKDTYEPFFFKKHIIRMLMTLKSFSATAVQLKINYRLDDIEIESLVNSNILVPYSYKFKAGLPGLKNLHSMINRSRLASLAVETRTPLFCKIELTYKCNFQCKHCYVKNLDSDYIIFDDLKKILYDLKSLGVLFIYLTGGEPLLHPEINEILKLCDEMNFITTLQTNGSLITEKHIELFKSLSHFSLGISYHSDDPEEFDGFTQTPGSFIVVSEILGMLKDSGLDYFLKIPVTTFNRKEILTLARRLREENIKTELNTQILPDIADKDRTESFQPENVDYLIPFYEEGFLTFTKTRCSACKDKLWIDPTGEVYPCELYRHSIGNIFEENIKTLWYGEKALDILDSEIYREPDICRDCSVKSTCNKCLAYREYEKWNRGLSFFCKKAKLIAGLASSKSSNNEEVRQK